MSDDQNKIKPARPDNLTKAEKSALALQVHDRIFNDVSVTRQRWRSRRVLYVRRKETVELLTKAAGVFFGLHQDATVVDLIMRLSRITDPSRTGEHENASLDQLRKLVGAIDQKNRERYDGLYAKVDTHVERLRIQRDKIVAHFPLHTVEVDPIPQKEVEEAFAAIFEFLAEVNTALAHQGLSDVPYHPSDETPRETAEILEVVAKALVAEEWLGLAVAKGDAPPGPGLTRENAIAFRRRWHELLGERDILGERGLELLLQAQRDEAKSKSGQGDS